MSDDTNTPSVDERVAEAQRTANAIFGAGFTKVKRVDPNGTIVVEAVTPSDTWTEEEWKDFAAECGGDGSW